MSPVNFEENTGYLRETINEYGTPVSEFCCIACGRVFTVCPAVPPERREEWTGCLGDECPSYDIARDIDMFFEPLMDAGLIGRDEAR